MCGGGGERGHRGGLGCIAFFLTCDCVVCVACVGGEGGHRGAILTNSHRVWVLKEPPVPLGADPALTPSEGHQHGTPQPVGQP